MNTQLQRVMVVLFLVLTLIVVIVLFWLPTDNDSNRVVAARESSSGGLLNLLAQKNTQNDDAPEMGQEESDSPSLDIMEEQSPVWQEQTESFNAELAQDEMGKMTNDDLVSDDAALRREYDPASYIGVGNSKKAEYLLGLQMDKSGKSGASASMPTMAAARPMMDSLKPSIDTMDYAYDVMGNKRAHVKDYTIRKNDWFSKITGKYWEDLFMWPDLYTMNTENLQSNNPDLIFPGEQVRIYESLTADGGFSEDDRRTLLSAYLKVYKIYKQNGASKDLAAAQLLASAVRYDKEFLEKYSAVIAAKDKQMAMRLVAEQKFLD